MKVVLIISIAVILSNCRDVKKQSKILSKNNNQTCLSKEDKEGIIHTILLSDDFKTFLFPEVEGRLPVKLVINDFVTSNLELYAYGQKVIFKDSIRSGEDTVHRLRIIDFDCESKEGKYSVFYPVEGAILTGRVIYSNQKWIVQDAAYGIKD